MAVHHPPESVFMINQNRCSWWGGICTGPGFLRFPNCQWSWLLWL